MVMPTMLKMSWTLNHSRHGAQPWEVQKAAMAARQKSGRNKFAYFMEQRLGKTPLSLNDFMTSDADLMLVVCPNSFRGDWAAAPEEWGVGGDVWSTLWPRSELFDRPLVGGRKELFVINYEATLNIFDSYKMLCRALEKRRVMLVLDETSYIKNPASKTSKAAIELAKRAQYVRELNGTPMTQSVMDYYAQLRVLGELNSIKPVVFKNRFAEMGGFMGRQVKSIKNEELLYSILGQCSFRALRADWQKDLPAQNDVHIHLEMTDRQRGHYDQMMEEFFTIVNDMEVSAELVITQREKARQISSGIIMKNGVYQEIEKSKDNPKIQAVLDLHDPSSKTIVVYTYRPSGEVLMRALQEFNPAYIRGSMDPADMLRQKQRFNNDPNCRVMLCQQRASCMGHTLLGGTGKDRCTRMIFYEDSYSLRDYLQMRDRNHGAGQDQPCTYYHLITSPVDQAAVTALIEKKSQADAVDAVVKAVRSQIRR
jgi:SNF2 family DNA or RNA helicase